MSQQDINKQIEVNTTPDKLNYEALIAKTLSKKPLSHRLFETPQGKVLVPIDLEGKGRPTNSFVMKLVVTSNGLGLLGYHGDSLQDGSTINSETVDKLLMTVAKQQGTFLEDHNFVGETVILEQPETDFKITPVDDKYLKLAGVMEWVSQTSQKNEEIAIKMKTTVPKTGVEDIDL